MKVAVLGAGIVGVTTAYELAADGHEVTVIEQHDSVAEEASFANAGVVAPGYVSPWAAPGMPGKVLSHLLSSHSPVRLSWPMSANDMAWIWKWWRNCKPAPYALNRARLQRLAFFSRERLHQLSADLRLEYDRSDGYMVLLRSDKDRAMVEAGLQVLRDAGVEFKAIDAAQARLIEPALNPDTAFSGAIHLPDDEVANCRQFASLLKAQAQLLGAEFHFNTTVQRIDSSQPTCVFVAGESEARRYDAIVVCAGLASARLLKPLGVRIPMTAVYGYSLTAPVRETLDAPRSGLMDERYKIAISRIGNRVRVAGSAEIGGSLAHKNEAVVQTLYKVLQDWFPGAAKLSGSQSGVQIWKGARPMLPDGPPIIGSAGVPGVWLNLGHGSSGWALSCASARLVADMLGGKKSAIDTEGLGLERLTRP
jgi:D-amino-acid dehydrogenase